MPFREPRWLSSQFARAFGLTRPVVQAPMAGVSGGALAGAVTAAGGLGMIGVGGSTSESWFQEQAALARSHGPFGVGLMVWVLNDNSELLDVVLAEHPAAVGLSFGDVGPYLERVHATGAKVLAQVQDAATARRALAAGADFLVAQGTEAGGHTGGVGTLPLLQEVLDLAEPEHIDVLAAGGIATGRGLAGVLAMGAVGAWIGTRFAATQEALGAPAAKQRILEADDTDTVHTRVFDIVQQLDWPQEFPGRALRNRFTDTWHGREDALRDQLPAANADFEDGRATRDYSRAYVYAGQASGLIDNLPSAGDLVVELSDDASARLASEATDG